MKKIKIEQSKLMGCSGAALMLTATLMIGSYSVYRLIVT
jgi:hypothetical protein